MVLKKISYYLSQNKFTINVKACDTVWSKFSGLMFRKSSPPLLFVFNKNKNLAIHSFFCKPFKAIWLDDKMRTTKQKIVKNWKPYISGYGKYLLEIPIADDGNVHSRMIKSSSTNKRNI